MLKDVRKDDIEQFNEEWTKVEFCKAPIFTDTYNVVKNIAYYYKTNFNDLVYGGILPNIENIKISIEKLLVFLP